jgi:hypothetical protein
MSWVDWVNPSTVAVVCDQTRVVKWLPEFPLSLATFYLYLKRVFLYFRAAGLLNIRLSPVSFAYSMKTLSTFRVTGSLNIFGVPVHVEILTNPNKGVRIFAIGFSFDGESFGALSKRLSGYEISFLDVLGIDLQVSFDTFSSIFYFAVFLFLVFHSFFDL